VPGRGLPHLGHVAPATLLTRRGGVHADRRRGDAENIVDDRGTLVEGAPAGVVVYDWR
jgi:hypothetical protein